ncbi:DciA family protein [Neisseriaceae bacterium ESL0693]|nr:DciA family protein [Neisseriaceae bacterium ESL0693]
MNLADFGAGNQELKQLLSMAAHWQKLNACLKRALPANLHDYFQVACVREGCLVVLAHHSMAAARLRMVLPAVLPQLQQIDARITTSRVKVQPVAAKKPVIKQAKLSITARQALAQSARAVSHHPDLARALQHLSEKDG